MTFISYAQNFEDVMLFRALKHIDRGFYVDVGANDPIINSVSYAFYKQGWRGINIEPVESFYKRLSSTRPLDINLPVAAADTEGELILYNIPDTGLSTTEEEIAHKQSAAGWPVEEQKVPALTLNQIFEEHINGPIHFLKIDVEGAEKAVLQGLDLGRWRPWIILVEATVPMSQELSYDSWESMVIESDYDMVYFDGLNRFYLAREQNTLADSFSTPPNVFDDFFPHSDDFLSTRHENLLIELDRIRSELDQKSGELNSVRSGLNGVREARDLIQSELNTIREEKDILHSELKAVREEKDLLRSELKAVREEKDFIHSELRTIREEKVSIRSELDRVQNELQAAKHEVDQVRRERDDIQAQLDEVWIDRDNILNLLEETRNSRDQIQTQLDEVWADRHKYWSELDAVYNSLSWKLAAPFRSLSSKIRAWKDRISRILHRPLSQNTAKFLRRIAVRLRRTVWGNKLLDRIKLRNSKLWYRVVSWMKRSDPAEFVPDPPLNFNVKDQQYTRNEKHFLSLFQRELEHRQHSIEDHK